MEIVIKKPPSGGAVRAIASKSHAHRLLICAAMADGDTFIECPNTSEDIDATVRCLCSLGAFITRRDGGFHVTPVSRGRVTCSKTLDCGESGSTLRFLLPVGCALGAEFNVLMRGRLPERTSAPLISALCGHGCEISGKGSDVLTCSGRLTSGRYVLPGDVSSQFISGLLLALPTLSGDSEIAVTGNTESAPYIDMTVDALGAFGVEIRRDGNLYSIRGGQTYCSPGSVRSEGDWSNAAFWLCAGAVGGAVTFAGLDLASRQGDKAIARILERFGAEVGFDDNAVTVSRGALRGIYIDASDTPDLVPILAVVAAAAEGETVISGARRLRTKESDRLATATEMLRALGADISETPDGLIIRGGRALSGGECSSHGDHRIAMAAAVASILCGNTVTIKNAEAVNKSYPGFFNDFALLGGAFEEV